jgi:hypothetical protein
MGLVAALFSVVLLLIGTRVRIAVDETSLIVSNGIGTHRVPIQSIRRSYLGFGRVIWIETTDGARPLKGPWPGTAAHVHLKEDIDWIASCAGDWSVASMKQMPTIRREAG